MTEKKSKKKQGIILKGGGGKYFSGWLEYIPLRPNQPVNKYLDASCAVRSSGYL